MRNEAVIKERGRNHPFGFEGNYDHYGTEECTAIMASGISDRPYVPFVFPDVTMSQYYNGMCPDVYDNFIESYEL